jgi:hypothetical protein
MLMKTINGKPTTCRSEIIRILDNVKNAKDEFKVIDLVKALIKEGVIGEKGYSKNTVYNHCGSYMNRGDYHIYSYFDIERVNGKKGVYRVRK